MLDKGRKQPKPPIRHPNVQIQKVKPRNDSAPPALTFDYTKAREHMTHESAIAKRCDWLDLRVFCFFPTY